MMREVTILAVDDIEENLVALAVLLKQPGLRLIEARSGTEALEALLIHDVALALLDVNMPGMDGFELAELMRGSERTRDVPIIFLTAAAPDRKRVFQGYEAGAVDFLFKPLDPHQLASKVKIFAQLHRQKRVLAEQLEQIRQAQAMSDLFVGVLGHDLRNPLGSIVSSADLLEHNPEDVESTRKLAGMIHRASRRMERLIQQVLDFALARVKGGIPVTIGDADLALIVSHVVLETSTDPSLEGRIRMKSVGDARGRWDADRLMQLVSNLISNAVEHGDPAGPIIVRVDGTDSESVVLEVRNGGVIPTEKLAEIFSAFKPRENHSRGLGLGLYIVEQIAKSHRAEISVLSEEASGTRFRLRLPRETRI